MIGQMRRESSTVVALVGEVPGALLAEVARSPNVFLARPPEGVEDSVEAAAQALQHASRGTAPYIVVPADPLAAVARQWRAMWDLSQGPRGAAGFEASAAEVLAAWRAGRFELPDYYLDVVGSQPADAGPDFYLGPLRAARPRRIAVAVAVGETITTGGPATTGGTSTTGRPPITGGTVTIGRAATTGRTMTTGRTITTGAAMAMGDAAATSGSGSALRVLDALRSLPYGPWWPPLDEIIDTARHFFPGALSEGQRTLTP
jgi:hypothetical protein